MNYLYCRLLGNIDYGDGQLWPDEVYMAYTSFCASMKNEPIHKNPFGKLLKSTFDKSKMITARDPVCKQNRRKIKGIQFKPNMDMAHSFPLEDIENHLPTGMVVVNKDPLTIASPCVTLVNGILIMKTITITKDKWNLHIRGKPVAVGGDFEPVTECLSMIMKIVAKVRLCEGVAVEAAVNTNDYYKTEYISYLGDVLK